MPESPSCIPKRPPLALHFSNIPLGLVHMGSCFTYERSTFTRDRSRPNLICGSHVVGLLAPPATDRPFHRPDTLFFYTTVLFICSLFPFSVCPRRREPKRRSSAPQMALCDVLQCQRVRPATLARYVPR